MEKLDRFVEDPFDGDAATLPIPREIVAQASVLIQELCDAAVEISSLIASKNEIDERMKTATSRFVIREFEDSYHELNKGISMLQNKRLIFHSDLDGMVQNICNAHQAEKTKYNELVKGRIDSEKNFLKIKWKAKNNFEQPPPKKTAAEPVVEEQPNAKAPETSVHKEPDG